MYLESQLSSCRPMHPCGAMRSTRRSSAWPPPASSTPRALSRMRVALRTNSLTSVRTRRASILLVVRHRESRMECMQCIGSSTQHLSHKSLGHHVGACAYLSFCTRWGDPTLGNDCDSGLCTYASVKHRSNPV